MSSFSTEIIHIFFQNLRYLNSSKDARASIVCWSFSFGRSTVRLARQRVAGDAILEVRLLLERASVRDRLVASVSQKS
jgi:hypothetical protein